MPPDMMSKTRQSFLYTNLSNRALKAVFFEQQSLVVPGTMIMPLEGGEKENEVIGKKDTVPLLVLQLSWEKKSQNLWPDIVIIYKYEFSVNG